MFVVLIRHAERLAQGEDPGLSQAGKVRAKLLASMMKGAGVSAIFVSEFKRTKETAAPLAAAIGKAPQVLVESGAQARARILAAGKRVLVVGHSNTVPELVQALGGPVVTPIAESEFDRYLVLHVPPTGAATLLELRYPPVSG